MSIQKILEMAENFVTLADKGTSPNNKQYQEQRNRLSKFYDHFTRQLRIIINEMGGNLYMLKERKFDHKMFALFAKTYQELITINKSIQEDKPYRAAEKLVQYVFDRSTKIILDNLDFLAKHHLKITNEDFVTSTQLQHPQIRSIDALKQLATELKDYMIQHPLIVPPGSAGSETPTEPPPAARRSFLGPENKLGPDDKTKT